MGVRRRRSGFETQRAHSCLCIWDFLPGQAVYTALKETEQRATDLLPLWKLPFLAPLVPRQRKALEAVALIRAETERLISQCKRMVDAEEQVGASSCCCSETTPTTKPGRNSRRT